MHDGNPMYNHSYTLYNMRKSISIVMDFIMDYVIPIYSYTILLACTIALITCLISMCFNIQINNNI
uniref:Uncharacterized protein n=1 Tax=Phage sp. ctL4h4 TaxID=2828005 RepID=A0A8S5TFG7_9VIRU|nr:MAG TPA: hypothetical protein [Phage sp. ctL4h4]